MTRRRAEVFNVRMERKETVYKRKRELNALVKMMKEIITTHMEHRSEFRPEAFRVVVVALEDTTDPYLCPHCGPAHACDAHVDSHEMPPEDRARVEEILAKTTTCSYCKEPLNKCFCPIPS